MISLVILDHSPTVDHSNGQKSDYVDHNPDSHNKYHAGDFRLSEASNAPWDGARLDTSSLPAQ